MERQVVFIGTFRIPDAARWRAAVAGMAEFVEANAPRALAFHAFANAHGDEGTVIHVHPDADSLDQQLAAAAHLIREGTQMVDVIRIELLGSPSPATVERMRAGGLPVSVKGYVTGFDR